MLNFKDKENIFNSQKADILSNYFYLFFDFLSYVFISFILKSKNKYVILLKYRLYIIFIIDIIFRIIYLKTFYFLNSLSKELILTLLTSSQFFTILSYIQIIPQIIYKSNEEKDSEYLDSFQISAYFFFIIFSYDKFINGFTKLISLLENLFILGCFFKLYGYLRNKVIEISLILQNKNKINEGAYLILEVLPFIELISLSTYFILKITALLVENSDFLFYINIFSIIFKDLSKYIIIYLAGFILYLIDRNEFRNKNSSFKKIIKVNQS